MEPELTLLVHPLCPFARRALYTMAYKHISADVVNVCLIEKP
jgi:hypothetical protein